MNEMTVKVSRIIERLRPTFSALIEVIKNYTLTQEDINEMIAASTDPVKAAQSGADWIAKIGGDLYRQHRVEIYKIQPEIAKLSYAEFEEHTQAVLAMSAELTQILTEKFIRQSMLGNISQAVLGEAQYPQEEAEE